jgi:hypothetical protein
MAECIAFELQPTAEVVPMYDITHELEPDRSSRSRFTRDGDFLVRKQ